MPGERGRIHWALGAALDEVVVPLVPEAAAASIDCIGAGADGARGRSPSNSLIALGGLLPRNGDGCGRPPPPDPRRPFCDEDEEGDGCDKERRGEGEGDRPERWHGGEAGEVESAGCDSEIDC